MLPADYHPSEARIGIRIDARLDAMTRAKVDDLATHFHQPRAAVVCAIMRWGLRHGLTGTLDQGQAQGPCATSTFTSTPPCTRAWSRQFLYRNYKAAASALHARVEQAASAAGLKLAPWLRQMVRQITMSDLPASWRTAGVEQRSHDSRRYGTRFMLRLDVPSAAKLQHLVTQFGASKADIIRQLIRQAIPDDFPKSWHLRVVERAARPKRPQRGDSREITP
jgi:hypothetical protein